MGALDFLFEGRPPKSVTTYGTTVQNVPTWLSDYTQGIIARGNAIAAEPYQPYGGPRIASFTPAQQSAFQLAQGNVGRYQPVLNAAIGQTASNPGQANLNTATQYAGQGADMTRGALNYSGLDAASPMIGQANQQVQGALGMSASGAAAPYLDQSAQRVQGALGMSSLNAASPFLVQGAQQFTGSNVDQYMNPYVDQVINRAGQLAGRQFNEQLMPGLEDVFTRNGQFGSTAHQQQAQRGARDLTEGLQSQAQSALAQAYGQAGQLFGADQSRIGQIGQTIGSLSTADQNAQLQGGQQLGALGQLFGNFSTADQNAQLQGASQYGSLASLLGNLGNAQQTAQLQGGQQMGALGQILGQLGATQSDMSLRSAGQMADMARLGQQMGGADAASLEAVGTTQQNQNQRNLDLAYQDFQQQRDYPRQQLDWLSNIIRGIPNSAIPTSTTSSQTGPSQVYQPSPLAQVGSLLTGIRGISALGQGT